MDTLRHIPNIELIMLGGTFAIALVMAVVGIATSKPKKNEEKK